MMDCTDQMNACWISSRQYLLCISRDAFMLSLESLRAHTSSCLWINFSILFVISLLRIIAFIQFLHYTSCSPTPFSSSVTLSFYLVHQFDTHCFTNPPSVASQTCRHSSASFQVGLLRITSQTSRSYQCLFLLIILTLLLTIP